jgi:hypothetical protein
VTIVLPPLTDMVRASEYTLTVEQELRLLDDRPRRSRWWVAPAGTVPPGPRVVDDPPGRRLAEEWRPPWHQVNSTSDDMVGVCVLNEVDASEGILIWVNPTLNARNAWRWAWTESRYVSLGCETGIYVDPDYRAVFRQVRPLDPIDVRTEGASRNVVRWAFRRPAPGLSSWDVMTARWVPQPARRGHPEEPREPGGIEP